MVGDDEQTRLVLANIPALNTPNANSLSNPYITLATSDNTRRAYRQDIRHFLTWGGPLPASSEHIAHYLEAHAAMLNPNTLARRLIALRHWHTYLGYDDPTAHPAIKKTLRGIQRVHGQPAKKAHALTPAELLTMHQYLEKEATLTAARDDALFQIGFFGALRSSELVNIRVEHLTWHATHLEILLPNTKTDATHTGQRCIITQGQATLCPIQALTHWLTQSGIEHGPIFRRIRRDNELGHTALNPLSITPILQTRAEQAGLTNLNQLSSHSLRRGFATSAALAGEPVQTIMRDGRWKSVSIAISYIDQANQVTHHASSKILDTLNGK